MHPADIQSALKKADVTQADIARRLGVTPTAVYHVLHGKFRSQRIAKAISQVVGKPIATLWPGMYVATSRKAA